MEQLAILIIGIIAPFLIGILKRAGICGALAAWVSFVVCAIMAGVLVLANGSPGVSLADPVAFLEALGPVLASVFALATLMYRTFQDRLPGLESAKTLETRRLDVL